MTREKTANLLVADDDYIVRRVIGHTFTQAGLAYKLFDTGEDLIKAINENTQACILDLQMPGKNGLECLKWIKDSWPDLEVIILTNINQAAEALEAIRCGAFDYITKPFDPGEFVHTVRKAMQLSRKQKENIDLVHSFSEPEFNLEVLGKSQSMGKVKNLVKRIGPSEGAVLLTGESGTGKTLLARAIHACSLRSKGPFISVSCPTLPGDLLESEMFGHEKGAFSGASARRIGRAELANGGTLFLDEIGDMPMSLQPKLLTFIQEKSFYRVGAESVMHSNVRIIAATNQELEKRVEEGSFREDLFFRLNVLPIHMPPLRERISDIPLLVDHFVALHSPPDQPHPKVEPEVYARFSEGTWKGNIRELENAVIRACTLRADLKRLTASDISGHLVSTKKESQSEPDYPEALVPVEKSLEEIEKLAIEQTLHLCQNNKAKAARILGIAEKSIYNKIKKYGLGK